VEETAEEEELLPPPPLPPDDEPFPELSTVLAVMFPMTLRSEDDDEDVRGTWFLVNWLSLWLINQLRVLERSSSTSRTDFLVGESAGRGC